jgi:hypothetical protein
MVFRGHRPIENLLSERFSSLFSFSPCESSRFSDPGKQLIIDLFAGSDHDMMCPSVGIGFNQTVSSLLRHAVGHFNPACTGS